MIQIQNDYSLKKLNTFGIDIKAKYFVEVFSDDELQVLITDSKLKSETKFILGGGSNTLFTKYFDGLVIKISIPGIRIVKENEENVFIEAGAGVVWNDLVSYSVEKNLGGIENLTLIPGSVGAAPIQNIGAYGQELSETFESLNGIALEEGSLKLFLKSDCQFGYRNSIFKQSLKNQFIVTSIILRLNKNPKVNLTYKQVEDALRILKVDNLTIRDVSNVVAKLRRNKLPYPEEIGNAGSYFKNPVVHIDKYLQLKKVFSGLISFDADANHKKIAAGWMIEECGWKGKRVGNVGTHEKHALVIVNHGNASGDEVLEFADRIVESVELKFGIRLENEVNIV